ncbi:MAG: hypothetical protein B6I31_03360 [Desulfobacteraceae bacterium 4572_19]|nr:MAG: hypothetical protein B6I31_03360 [Desulfobacteraceae bacterium 4572_19]
MYIMKKTNILFITIIISHIFFITAVHAHKVTVFAWVEGDTIYTQSKFSGGKKAINAQITVYGADDTILVKGKTDNKGLFSFPTLRNKTLKIVLSAGMGHRAQWILNENEITASCKNTPQADFLQTDSSQTDSSQTKSSQTKSSQTKSSQTKSLQTKSLQTKSSQANSSQTYSPQTELIDNLGKAPVNSHTPPYVSMPSDIEAVIEKAIDKKLNTIIKMLADTNQTTSIRDIMGAIGYIFGLVGIAVYFNSRKKQQKDRNHDI